MFSATLIGRLGKAPELRSTAKGDQICSFTVASDHGYGERKTTTWTKVVIFGKQAENAAAWLAKGSKVAVTGDVYLDEWTDKEGGKRQTLTMDARSFENLTPKSSDDAPPRSQSRRDDRVATPEDDGEIPY